MGTNYYVRTPPSPLGLFPGEEIHLGKSSAGWTFSFRAYPDPELSPQHVTWPVRDFPSWHRLLSLGAIFDEYGREVTAEDLLVKIEGKRGGHDALYGSDYRDPDGNRFTASEFS